MLVKLVKLVMNAAVSGGGQSSGPPKSSKSDKEKQKEKNERYVCLFVYLFDLGLRRLKQRATYNYCLMNEFESVRRPFTFVVKISDECGSEWWRTMFWTTPFHKVSER